MQDLRAVLCEDIQRLRDGKIEPKTLNAVVQASGTVIRSISLELSAMRLAGRTPQSAFLNQVTNGNAMANGKPRSKQ